MSPVEDIKWMCGYGPRVKVHAVRLDTRWRYSLCGQRDMARGDYEFDLAQIEDAQRVLDFRPFCDACLVLARGMLAAASQGVRS